MVWFEHIYFSSFGKQILKTYINLEISKDDKLLNENFSHTK